MNRFRGTDVALGLVAVAVNIGLVVGVVAMTSNRETPGAEATVAVSPSASPSTSTTVDPTEAPSPPSARSLITSGEPVSLAVLGDQTSDGDAEWVGVMAALLGQDHRVELRGLDPSDPTVYAKERSYGSSGSKISIRNASRAGVKADYAAPRLPLLVPVEADLVILNYGRNDSADKVAGRLEKTAKAVRRQLPQARVLVTLQAPTAGDGQQDVREAVSDWAEESDLPTLDIAAAFEDTGRADSYISGRDPLVMSSAGDELWGREVYRLLTGKEAATPDAPQPSQTTEAGTPAGSGTTGGTGAGGGTGPVAPQPEPSNVGPTPTGGATPSADPTPTTPPPATDPPPSTPEPTTTDPGTGEAEAWLPGPALTSAAV